MPMKLLYAVIIVTVFSFFMGRKNRKVRAATWTGTVTDIRHQRANIVRDEDRHDEDWVTVCYRTDAGGEDKLKIRVRVMRQYFSSLAVGDRLVKNEGDYLPRIESTSTASAEI